MRRYTKASSPACIREFTITRISREDFPTNEPKRTAFCVKRFLSQYEKSLHQVALGLPENAPAAGIIEGFVETLLDYLRHLISQSDKGAATALARVSRNAVKALNEVALKQPELVMEYAQTCPNWPVLHSPNRAFCDSVNLIQKRIRLAEKIVLTGEVAQLFVKHRPKILRGMAIELLRQIEFHRISAEVIFDSRPSFWIPDAVIEEARRLRPFGPKSWEKWENLAWRIVLCTNKGKPEASASWKKFGMHKKDKAELRKAHPNHASLKKHYPSDQRAAIRSRLRTMICSLSETNPPLVPDWPV